MALSPGPISNVSPEKKPAVYLLIEDISFIQSHGVRAHCSQVSAVPDFDVRLSGLSYGT